MHLRLRNPFAPTSPKNVAPVQPLHISPSLAVSHAIVPVAGAIAAVFLLATALAHLIFREETAHLTGFSFIDVDNEANLPTWYASLLLELTAVIAFVISYHDAPAQKTGWRGIALLLVIMGMDEIASFHNAPNRRMSEMVGLGDGYLMNAWVIPASLLCLVLAVIYLPFMIRMPSHLRRSLIGAAIAYLIGAVVYEVVSSKFEYMAGGLDYDGSIYYSLRFELFAVVEEIFEYVGCIAAMAALLRHASNLGASLTLRF